MPELFDKVLTKVNEHVTNNYTDNHDVDRFGAKPPAMGDSAFKRSIRRLLFKNRVHKAEMDNSMRALAHLARFEPGLENLYNALENAESRQMLIDLVVYRILGADKFKLKTNTAENREKLLEIRGLADRSESIDPHFMQQILHKYDLSSLGYDLKLFFVANGIFVDFFLEQYRYRAGGIEIAANPGDVVIDAGGCWGDTALYFASRVGETGKVYTFEFIPNNIDIFRRNIALNPELGKRIHLLPNPVWSQSGIKTYFKDLGPASHVSFEPFTEMTGSTETLSIDDFVSRNQISKVDFIKMDIEGAEGAALEGARKTIERFKPKLALAIYHSNEQFVDVPKWVQDLNLGYRLYLDHFTIHTEETVLYAQAL